MVLRRLVRRSRRAGWLVISSHDPGPLPTCLRTEGSPQLLRELVDQLVDVARAPPDRELASLVRRHDGNLRACLRTLYDRWSTESRIAHAPTAETGPRRAAG
jgi:hypothetical protein